MKIVRDASKPEPWKALLMIDRLLFACPPLKSGGISATRQLRNRVVERTRVVWRGQWQDLIEDANVMCAVEPRAGAGEADKAAELKKTAGRVEAMLAAGEQGRALKAATGATSLVTDTSAIPLINTLFPPEARTGAPSTPDGGGDDVAFSGTFCPSR